MKRLFRASAGKRWSTLAFRAGARPTLRANLPSPADVINVVPIAGRWLWSAVVVGGSLRLPFALMSAAGGGLLRFHGVAFGSTLRLEVGQACPTRQ